MSFLSVYTIPIQTALRIFPFLAILILVPLSVRHYQQYGRLAGWRTTVVYAFVFFLICAYCLIMLPLPEITPDFCRVYSEVTPIYSPFEFLGRVGNEARVVGIINALTSFEFLEVFFNFLLLFPLGFFLRYLFQFRFRTVLLISFLVSLSFEITQLTGIYGLYPCAYRVFSVDDLLLNTSGSLLGYAVMPLFAFLPKVDRSALLVEDDDYVSVFRRGIAFILDYFFLNLVLTLLVPVIMYPQNLFVILLWFVVGAYLGRGRTLGKQIVRIRIVALEGSDASFRQLTLRYLVYLGLPWLATVLVYLPLTQPEPDGFVDGVKALIAIGFMLLILLVLSIPPIVRRDHRGLPDWIARTKHEAINPSTASSDNPAG